MLKGNFLFCFQNKLRRLTQYANPLINHLFDKLPAVIVLIKTVKSVMRAYPGGGTFSARPSCREVSCVVSYRCGGCSPPRILLIGDTLNAARLFSLFLSSRSCSFCQRLRRITTAATTTATTTATHHRRCIPAISRRRRRSDRPIHGRRHRRQFRRHLGRQRSGRR